MLQEQNPSCVSALNPAPSLCCHKCILVFKCPNELVPPYLSDYFIRNRTIHTYNTRQGNDIHRPNPKLTIEKKKHTFRFSGAVLFNNLPTSIKEAMSLAIYKNFLSFHFSH